MRRGLIAGLAALAALLAGAPGATARDEAGNRCIGDDLRPDSTLIGFANQSPTTPFVPAQIVMNGVVTRWRVQAAPGLEPLLQQLVVFKQTEEESARKVAESQLETVVSGANEFAARIPVPEFSFVGLHGPASTLVCGDEALHTSGLVTGPYALGEDRHYEVQVNLGVPVVAVIEPDRDFDGYGDETQDGCFTLASTQGPCPPVSVEAKAVVRKRAIVVEVGVGSDASVRMSGQVRWRMQRRGKQAGKRTLTAGLSAGGERRVLPGTTEIFQLPLTKSVLRRLGQLKPSQSLRAQLTAEVTDVGNQTSAHPLTVKLPGRG